MTERAPSGSPPPSEVRIAGTLTQLAPLAAAICERYYREFPDEIERYGEAGGQWCRHDNQWLLSWAVGDVLGATSLTEQVCWLARVLHARDFPVARLARNLQIAAELASEGGFGARSPAVAACLNQAADTVAGLEFPAPVA